MLGHLPEVASQQAYRQAGQHFVPGPACFSGRQHPGTLPQQTRKGGLSPSLQCWGISGGQRSPRLHALPVLNSSAVTDGAAAGGTEDKWIARVLAEFQPSDESPPLPYPLEAMQTECTSALRTQRMPTTRNEEYRFTDVGPLLQIQPQVASPLDVDGEAVAAVSEAHSIKVAAAKIVVIDGVVSDQLSSTEGLPHQAFVGSLRDAPLDLMAQYLGQQARTRGSPFAIVNGATAQDVLCVYVPDGVHLDKPIHVLYIPSGHSTMAAPRLLCVLGTDAAAEVIEEFVSPATDFSTPHVTNALAEMELAQGARLKHGYVCLEGRQAMHMKGTLVRQAASSTYKLTEARLGGRLTRQDVNVAQEGEETRTEMRSFLLCGDRQLHDLHSKLRLEHPRGTADQLHKCIVAAGTGRGVFDGNVRVEQKAQKTDAGQLSRNLLLVPRATVNVKPNLQIVADDVKCTHGCAVSDLEEDQLFYFRARGVDSATARRVLVYSFGAEVTTEWPYQQLRDRIQSAVDLALANVPIMESIESEPVEV
ncbi:g8980 [Coccomyxa viridis]|uniref:G8980 protein n=1 Tax=Coccomyxa viridis TaxID=1274662 RepID=A0ABP1G4D1_9CHLO